MTKKRIGTIYGSPIVEGDKNLKTSNEIHVSELGGGNSGSEKYLYFKWEGHNPNVVGALQEVAPVFNGVLLITDVYSKTLSKNINIVLPTVSFGSGIGDDSKISGLTLMNLPMTNPLDGAKLNAIGYLQLMLQTDDYPNKEEVEFLLAHKVSEEEFFKDVEAYIS